MRTRRKVLWATLVGVVAAALAVLLVLIALGILVLPGTAPSATVNVTAVHFTILQGTNQTTGLPWFGPSPFNETGPANGYPLSVAPGAAFSVPVVLTNNDHVAHTLYSVGGTSPFTVTGTNPGLPVSFPPGEDEIFVISLTAPSGAGATVVLDITLNALPPSP